MNREFFSNDIVLLKKETLDMMKLVKEIIIKSIRALLEKDVKMAKSIYQLDDEVDKIMEEIELKAIELIALQQPMAKDLRIIFAITKIVNELERIGDFCVNISKEVIKIGEEDHIKPLVDIPKIQDIILDMLENTITSFEHDDYELAYKVGLDDEIVDNLYKDIYNDILILINKDSSYINQGTKILFIGRYLERIADHITNICEMIIYINTGNRVEIN